MGPGFIGLSSDVGLIASADREAAEVGAASVLTPAIAAATPATADGLGVGAFRNMGPPHASKPVRQRAKRRMSGQDGRLRETLTPGSRMREGADSQQEHTTESTSHGRVRSCARGPSEMDAVMTHVELVVTLDSEDVLETLVERCVTGDELAWQRMWEAIEPRLLRMIAQPRFLGPLGQREDDCRNIAVEVLARLRADDFHRLTIYLETRRTNPSLKFMTWLRVVAKRVGIDYMRGHPDYIDRRRQADRGSAPGEWVQAGTLPSGSKLHGERPPFTNRGTAQQLLRYAAGAIPDTQRRALELWVQCEPYDEIARVLELEDADAAERTVRSAIERLRRRFRVEEDQ